MAQPHFYGVFLNGFVAAQVQLVAVVHVNVIVMIVAVNTVIVIEMDIEIMKDYVNALVQEKEHIDHLEGEEEEEEEGAMIVIVIVLPVVVNGILVQ